MDEYLNIANDDIPAWYDLGINEENNALLIHVHQFALEFIQRYLLPSARIIEYMEEDKELELSSFIPPTEDVWGFRETLRWVKPREINWHTLECLLPVICNSEDKIYWKQATNVSATLILYLHVYSFQIYIIRDQINYNY